MRRTSKSQRILAVLVGAVLLLTALSASLWGLNLIRVKAADTTGGDDRQMAADISNMTGVKIDDILELKSQGKSWNEILTMLKSKNTAANEGNSAERSGILTSNGLSDDTVTKLKKDGFTNTEITEAKMLVERVLFQLDEIKSGSENTAVVPVPDTAGQQKDDTAGYIRLEGQIDEDTAVRLMLELKKDFGSIDNVLDEYLLSLQLGLKLEDYLTDKEAYLKSKDEKSTGADPESIITIEKIEAEMLKILQNRNITGTDTQNPDATDQNSGFTDASGPENILPEIPGPDVKSVKPPNPADEIKSQIDAVNPQK